MDRAEFTLSRPVCLSLPVEEVDKLLREKDGRCALTYLALLRAGMGSRAELFIAQMQDVLGLGAESRMNTPGTASGNWVWRLLPGQADAQTAARLLARTQAACRI